MERVINIVGLGESSKDVPDHGEIWALNVSYKKLIGKKIDKLAGEELKWGRYFKMEDYALTRLIGFLLLTLGILIILIKSLLDVI